MKVLKSFATGFIALATAVVTLGTSAAIAQEYDVTARPGLGRGDRDRDRGDRDGAQRLQYLGTTGLVSKSRYETREIYVGDDRQYSSLEFRARDDAFELRNAVVYFRNGGSRNLGGARIGEGGRVRADFNNSRRIESIVIQGISANRFGSKAQLEVYGRR